MVSNLLDLADLERGGLDGETASRKNLDSISDEMGLRVTVRRNGTLAVQFNIPAALVPPGSQDEIIIEETAAMLSRTPWHSPFCVIVRPTLASRRYTVEDGGVRPC